MDTDTVESSARMVRCPLCEKPFKANSEEECVEHLAHCKGFEKRHGKKTTDLAMTMMVLKKMVGRPQLILIDVIRVIKGQDEKVYTMQKHVLLLERVPNSRLEKAQEKMQKSLSARIHLMRKRMSRRGFNM